MHVDMPTVLRIGGLRVVIYPNDHRPAHVHVIGDGEAVFILRPRGTARAARVLLVQPLGCDPHRCGADQSSSRTVQTMEIDTWRLLTKPLPRP